MCRAPCRTWTNSWAPAVWTVSYTHLDVYKRQVYSLSDPRAVVFKGFVQQLAEAKGRKEDFNFYNAIERLAPQGIAEKRHIYKGVSTNLDFYSCLLYTSGTRLPTSWRP